MEVLIKQGKQRIWLKQVGGLRLKFNVDVGKGIKVRFDKVNKRGGDGGNGRCLASKMSGEESVKDNGVLRKLGRVMGKVQSKQVAVDFGWELEKISKLIV